MAETTQHRAVFDAAVTFSNGGDLTARGFRLDVPGPDTGEDEIAALLVAHLGLLMVASVELSGLEIVAEAHRGGRAVTPTIDAASGRRHVVDLAHVVTDGLVTYPGIPAPVLGSHLSFDASAEVYAPGTEFTIGMITMATNTGTYLDTPAHRYRGGDDLATFPLTRMVDLDGLVVRVADRLGGGRPEIDELALAGHDVAGKAVLVETGHARHWGSQAYFTDHPYLTAAAADWLVDHGAALVGIDSLNVDGTHTGERPVHSRLLAAGIPVVEHLTNLDRLPPTGFRFTAAPPKVAGLGTFTVRAFAVVDGPDRPVEDGEDGGDRQDRWA
jgi:kynurenine formamidase